MSMQERINTQGTRYIACLRETVRACWRSACQHEGIDPSASFVVFSDNNPFVPFHDRAYAEYREAQRQYSAGGYVGLKIGKRS